MSVTSRDPVIASVLANVQASEKWRYELEVDYGCNRRPVSAADWSSNNSSQMTAKSSYRKRVSKPTNAGKPTGAKRGATPVPGGAMQADQAMHSGD